MCRSGRPGDQMRTLAWSSGFANLRRGCEGLLDRGAQCAGLWADHSVQPELLRLGQAAIGVRYVPDLASQADLAERGEWFAAVAQSDSAGRRCDRKCDR